MSADDIDLLEDRLDREAELLDAIVLARRDMEGGGGVMQPRQRGLAIGSLARTLVRDAYYASLDRKKTTPYSLGAAEEFNLCFSGGKADDITVVAAVVEAAATTKRATDFLER